MNPKNTKKSPIHENADANITCDFGDISRLGVAYLTHVIHTSLARTPISYCKECIIEIVAYVTQAQDIYKMSMGKQQVLPLDSVYKKNLPDWSK